MAEALAYGNPLSWEETKSISNNFRELGIKQYMNIFHRFQYRNCDPFKWGEEIEYSVVKLDDKNKKARLSLSAPDLLKVLNQKQRSNSKSLYSGEFASYMLEACPKQPYEGFSAYINSIESNFKERRKEVAKYLTKDESIMTLSDFPLLGVEEFSWPTFQPQPDRRDSIEHSSHLPNEFYAVPLYTKIAQNIRERHGESMKIMAKVFKDVNTKIPVEGAPPDQPDAVYMDAVGFGLGCCSLQVTFQASDLNEARNLHDQLAPICPIMLALTAASPVFRGYLVDTDCRWNVISAATDDRTPGERGEKSLNPNEVRIPKSRWDSINSYVTKNGQRYNDVPLVYDENVYRKLRDANIDHSMAQHIAQLFFRDILSVFKENVDCVNEQGCDHIEQMLKQNWPTIKLKPPVNSELGWRIEFRPCELNITDFENAAIVCFMVLLNRIIIAYNLNFLVPISKIDLNMQTAHKFNACQEESFWFRRDIFTKPTDDQNEPIDNEYVLLTIDEIMNGSGSHFYGIIPLMKKYLESMDIDDDTRNTIKRYLGLIEQRAAGKLMTTAQWIRKEIIKHPHYKKDSIVSERINYDLIKKFKEIQDGIISCRELHGSLIQYTLNLR